MLGFVILLVVIALFFAFPLAYTDWRRNKWEKERE